MIPTFSVYQGYQGYHKPRQRGQTGSGCSLWAHHFAQGGRISKVPGLYLILGRVQMLNIGLLDAQDLCYSLRCARVRVGFVQVYGWST